MNTPFEQFKDSAVIIMGHPKSGTTLLTALLDNHPQLVVFPLEIAYNNVLYKVFKGKLSNEKKLEILLRKIGVPEYELYNGSYGIEREKFLKTLYEYGKRSPENDDRSLFLSFIEGMHAMFESVGGEKKAWVEKTTWNYLLYPMFKKWFGNNLVCLHVVRNPYDDFASYRKFIRKEMKREGPSVDEFCLDWELSNKIAAMAQKEIPRYYIIRYEDITNYPEETMKKVSSWLGISFTTNLLQPTLNGHPWGGNSMHGVSFRGISTTPIGKHKELLTEKEIRRMRRLLYGTAPLFRVKLYWRLFAFKMRWMFPSAHQFFAKMRRRIWRFRRAVWKRIGGSSAATLRKRIGF